MFRRLMRYKPHSSEINLAMLHLPVTDKRYIFKYLFIQYYSNNTIITKKLL